MVETSGQLSTCPHRYPWCEKSQNICDVYDDGAGCTKCLKVKDMNHCYDAGNSKTTCDNWGKDYLWCGN